MVTNLKFSFADFHEHKMKDTDLKLISDAVSYVEGELLKHKRKDAEFSKKIFGGG